VPDQIKRILNFLLIKRRVSGMCGGVEDPFSTGKDVVDEFDLPQSFHMIDGCQLAKPVSISFESTPGCRIERVIVVQVIVA